MTLDDITAELRERIARTRQELDDSRKLAPNSYGHGYEAGALDAYTQMLDWLSEAE